MRRSTTLHEKGTNGNPNTSPTTRNAVFPAAALSRITSAFDSTRSRSAIMTFLPKNSSFPLCGQHIAYQFTWLYSENRSVVLEKNLVAALHSFQSSDSNVLLVSKSQTNEIQHRRCFELKKGNPRFLSHPQNRTIFQVIIAILEVMCLFKRILCAGSIGQVLAGSKMHLYPSIRSP